MEPRAIPEVTIDRLANGGDGVGRLPDGRVIFVPGTLPGERVRVRLTQSKKNFARGAIIALTSPSPGRVEPECPKASECGGCSFWHATYETELAAKVEAAVDTLERIGKLSAPAPTVFAANTTAGYRVRARLAAQNGRLGFHAPRSADVVPVTDCRILAPPLRAFVRDARPPAGLDAAIFIETAGDDEVCVTIEASGEAASSAARAWAGMPGVRGVTFGEGETVGIASIRAREFYGVESLDFELPAGLFRQGNPAMNDVLREVVREAAGTGSGVDELFAGSGNLTLALVDRFESVTAYDGVGAAISAGRELAAALSAAHMSFEAVDLNTPPAFGGPTIVLDPPRTGAAAVCAKLADGGPERIVYVSCDVACLARDLKTLGERWQVQALAMIDMFPRTPHIEVVATLVPA